MATAHQSDQTGGRRKRRTESSAKKFRIDAAHGALPELAQLPDLTELLVEAAHPSSVPQPPSRAMDDTADDIRTDPARPDRLKACPTDRATDDAAASIQVDPPATPAFQRPSPSRPSAKPSGLARVASLPGRVPDAVFWSSVAAVLLLVAVVVWFGRGNSSPAEMPNGWDTPETWSESVTRQPGPPHDGSQLLPETGPPPATETAPTQVPPPGPYADVQPPASSGAEQALEPEPALPPVLPSGAEEVRVENETETPGVARLHGIIESPDLRVRNDRTESRLR